MTVRTPSLTDRYVWAVSHRLPEGQRADVESELRATIADMVDARLAAASPSAASPSAAASERATEADAEAAVLTELGDPARLAAEYRGRPNYLIGPDLFDDYLRLLRLLLWIVPTAAGGGVAVAGLVAGNDLLDVIVSAGSVAITAALHVAFWVTLGFVVVERTGVEPPHRRKDWEPSQLPELPGAGRVSVGDVVTSVVFSALAIGLLVWQRGVSSFTTADGEPIPFFNPERWTFWLPFIIVVLAADAVADLARLRRRRWTYGSAAVKTALGAALVVPFLGLLGADPLFNPAFFAELAAVVGGTTPGDLVQRSIVVAVVVITAWEIVEGWVKARRAARS